MSRAIILLLLFVSSFSKVFETEVTFTSFRRSNGWFFLTKMILEQGQTNINLKTSIRGVPFSTLEPIELSVIQEENWQTELNQKCASENNFQRLTQTLMADGTPTTSQLIMEIDKKSTYYFVLRDCSQRLSKEYSNNNLFINITLTILNNGSHLSADEDNWLIFPLMIGICLWLIFRNKKENKWGEDFDWAQFLLLSAVATNFAALFWKAVGFLIYRSSGHDYALFDIFYLAMHSLSETIVICLLVMISYGWTINYLNGQDFDLYIPLMTMLGLLNIIITILNKINDGDHDKYHMFDSVPGYLLIGFRCIIAIICIVGIIMTYNKSIPKKKPFVVQFGILSLLNIFSLPLVIIIAELYVQERSQKEFVFITVEVLKVLTTILLTYMITSKKSSYAKICYKNMSFLPQNEKFF